MQKKCIKTGSESYKAIDSTISRMCLYKVGARIEATSLKALQYIFRSSQRRLGSIRANVLIQSQKVNHQFPAV